MKGKVAILNKPGQFSIEVRDVNPGPDQVLVKVSVCGLCNWEKGFFTGVIDTPADSTLGHEWAGIVAELGENVTEFAVGDKVTVLPAGLEGFAEYAVVDKDRCFKLSEKIDIHEGFMEPLKCVVTVCRSAAPEPGDFGIVIGCGPMGLWCTQILSGHTLAGLIAIDVDDTKLAMAKKFGASYTINSAKVDAVAEVKKITGGHMADFVIEGTGITALIPTIAPLIRTTQGRVVLMSYYEKNSVEFDWRPFADKGAIITNPQPSFSLDQLDDARRAVELINNGSFHHDGMISHKFPLDEIQKAFETVSNKPADYIKGVVICDE